MINVSWRAINTKGNECDLLAVGFLHSPDGHTDDQDTYEANVQRFLEWANPDFTMGGTTRKYLFEFAQAGGNVSRVMARSPMYEGEALEGTLEELFGFRVLDKDDITKTDTELVFFNAGCAVEITVTKSLKGQYKLRWDVTNAEGEQSSDTLLTLAEPYIDENEFLAGVGRKAGAYTFVYDDSLGEEGYAIEDRFRLYSLNGEQMTPRGVTFQKWKRDHRYVFREMTVACHCREYVYTIKGAEPGAYIQGGPVFITKPNDRSSNAGAMTVMDGGDIVEGADSYQWQYSDDNGKTWYDCATGFTGPKSIRVLFTATADMNGWLFRLAATNSAGTNYSLPARLTIKDMEEDWPEPVINYAAVYANYNDYDTTIDQWQFLYAVHPHGGSNNVLQEGSETFTFTPHINGTWTFSGDESVYNQDELKEKFGIRVNFNTEVTVTVEIEGIKRRSNVKIAAQSAVCEEVIAETGDRLVVTVVKSEEIVAGEKSAKIGVHDAMLHDGSEVEILRSVPSKRIFVNEESELQDLNEELPGTIAIQYGYAAMWQKGPQGDWLEVQNPEWVK